MASILEQYNDSMQATRQVSSGRPIGGSGNPAISITGTQVERPVGVVEPAMFQRTKVLISFPSNITHFTVSNGFVVIVMENKILRRVNLQTKVEQEIELPRDDEVLKIFIDITGNHVILSMRSLTILYLHRISDKPKILQKFNGLHVTCVGWSCEEEKLLSTGSILIGTSKGALYETCLVTPRQEDKNFLTKLSAPSAEQYCKLVYEFDDAVIGCEFGKITSSNQNSADSNYYFIICTKQKIYQFFGTSITTSPESSSFLSVFEQYQDVQALKYIELPGEAVNPSLQVFRPPNKKAFSTFAWKAGPGVYCGNIDFTARNQIDDVIQNPKLIEISKLTNQRSDLQENLIGMVLNEFHITLLFKNRLMVICILNEKVVWEDNFEPRDDLQGICRDSIKNSTWLYGAKKIYRIKVTNESRDVWKTFMELEEYDRARSHCRDDPEKLDLINRKQADALFQERKYDQSAVYYSHTQMSFEEITLKFIEQKQDGALRTFLERKLNAYTRDRVQMTMLITWLVELWLNQLGKLKDHMEDHNQDDVMREIEIMQEEFNFFLRNGDYQACFKENKTIIYDLIASHGKMDDLVLFAELMEDYEKLISHHLQHDQYEKALEQLQKQGNPGLIYRFSPVLMQHVPESTVKMWQDLSSKPGRAPLEPKKLIPALVQYDAHRARASGQSNQAIQYLNFCIKKLKNRDQAIHNYLISLYSEYDPESLLKYLAYQGQDADNVNYDLKYALRLCSQKKLLKACVHIYATMGLYAEAVDLAIQVNLQLARENADKPDDEDEKKKLWLKIARHVVENEKDIDKAMKVLEECELLKIEDILPFFPDFVTIDKFKDSITRSLSEYNEHIGKLKTDMTDTTTSAEIIREQIQHFRKKSCMVRTYDKCSVCNFTLITRAFYIFPCSHKFHSDCLISEVIPGLSDALRRRVEDLQRKLASRDDSYSITSTGSAGFAKQSEKAELDDLVASECIYCGESIIMSIDKPLVTRKEYDEARTSWS